MRPEPVRHQLAALGVAAAWRLGRWDLLDRYLPAAQAAGPELLDSADRWEVRLGCLLSAVSKGRSAELQEQVCMGCRHHCCPCNTKTTTFTEYRCKLHCQHEHAGLGTCTLRLGQHAHLSTVPASIADTASLRLLCIYTCQPLGSSKYGKLFGCSCAECFLYAPHTAAESLMKGCLALQMAEARQDIMAPLSAASMESYSRAYPHLTRLHMLQELADAAALRQARSATSPLHHVSRVCIGAWFDCRVVPR